MRTLVSTLAFLVLAGCFDAEMVLDFKDQANVETSVTTRLGRSFYDMASLGGDDPCEGGQATVEADTVTCVQIALTTIDAAVAQPNPFGKTREFDLTEGMAIEKLDDNTVLVTVNLDQLDSDANTPDQIKGMDDVAAAAFAGHSIVYRVKGYRILETTGTLSEDGKEAKVVIPIPGLITGNPGVASPFTTKVQLARKCKFLGLFCD